MRKTEGKVRREWEKETRKARAQELCKMCHVEGWSLRLKAVKCRKYTSFNNGLYSALLKNSNNLCGRWIKEVWFIKVWKQHSASLNHVVIIPGQTDMTGLEGPCEWSRKEGGRGRWCWQKGVRDRGRGRNAGRRLGGHEGWKEGGREWGRDTVYRKPPLTDVRPIHTRDHHLPPSPALLSPVAILCLLVCVR